MDFYSYKGKEWPDSAIGYFNKGVDSCLGRTKIFAIRCYYHSGLTSSVPLTIEQRNELCSKTGIVTAKIIRKEDASFLAVFDNGSQRLEIFGFYPKDATSVDEEESMTVTNVPSSSPRIFSLDGHEKL